MRGDKTVMAKKKKKVQPENLGMGCTRTDDVFEAFQFPCDKCAGGPCYDRRLERGVRKGEGRNVRQAYET